MSEIVTEADIREMFHAATLSLDAAEIRDCRQIKFTLAVAGNLAGDYTILCDGCDHEESFNNSLQEAALWLEQHGWEVWGTKLKCRRCVHGEPMSDDEISERCVDEMLALAKDEGRL
jgi:hypothetical protein